MNIVSLMYSTTCLHNACLQNIKKIENMKKEGLIDNSRQGVRVKEEWRIGEVDGNHDYTNESLRGQGVPCSGISKRWMGV